MTKIAIIGCGFYGGALAIKLSKDNLIDVYENQKKIMQGASRVNQFRYHMGYHYPRSLTTIDEIKKADEFNKRNNYFYPFTQKTYNYYGIAEKNTKTSIKKYFEILNKSKLKFKIFDDLLDKSILKKFIKSSEFNLNYFKYKNDLEKKIKKNKNINLFLNRTFTKKDKNKYDKIIVCTYSNNNKVLKNLGIKNLKKYKYELVEKILVKLPSEYKNKSYVILDGQFVNIDPYLGTPYHLLSNVKFSKIEVIEGFYPNFKSSKKSFLNKGIIKNIKMSNYNKFIQDSHKMLPFLKKSSYKGSLFVTRTIERNKIKTDERRVAIQKHNKKIYSIFSSKWNLSYLIANKLSKKINVKK